MSLHPGLPELSAHSSDAEEVVREEGGKQKGGGKKKKKISAPELSAAVL